VARTRTEPLARHQRGLDGHHDAALFAGFRHRDIIAATGTMGTI
jgi:hypothetical protein